MSSQTILRNLEITFGKIPTIIEANLKYLSYNEEYNDFKCVPCQKIIEIVENNEDSTTRNFEKHLLSKAHIKCTISNEELLIKLKVTFLGNIPQIVHNNLFVLGVDGNDYECAKCEKLIKVGRSIEATENNFSYHLLSALHEENLEEYRDVLSELHNVYGGIPLFVLNHAQFLSRNGRDYLCTICNKTIMVHPSNVVETEKIFEMHLHSLKHMRIAKQAKAFSLFPELKKIFQNLPDYMLRNIEYISVNGPNFFCSLCHENIKYNRHDLYDTKQNFKFHISSELHEDGLSARRDADSDVFIRIQMAFETYPGLVLENLKYISIDGDNFYCNVCKDTINDSNNVIDTEQNLVHHFQSNHHADNINCELMRRSEVIEELKDVFGSVPESIIDNIEHIVYVRKDDYKCDLCNKIMKSKSGDDYEYNTSITTENFERHLNSNKHNTEVEELEKVNDDLETDLNGLFSPIPQFIMNNLEHIGYEENSDDFNCYLCDKMIAVGNGNKKTELTKQNFRIHLLSVDHMAKLKHKANLEMEATEKLEFVFNKVPYIILNNIQYIENQYSQFYCTLCDAKIMKGVSSETLKLKLQEHLCGARHQSNMQEEEDDIDEALQRLEQSFSHIPEFLMKNIDYMTISGDDLFCVLCQTVLHIDEDNVEETKQSLQDHMDSSIHQSNLKSM